MKYGAPEEIRTPDPQIRSLTNGSEFPLSIKGLPKPVCFQIPADRLIGPLFSVRPKHTAEPERRT